MRCLFIAWNDGHPPSQITVPANYRLPTKRGLLGKRNLPATLTVLSDDAHTELYIDRRLVRSAYLVTIGTDQRIVDLTAA